jgi:hypothetical protein
MKKTLLAVVAASLLFARPAVAFDGGQAGQGPGAPFEERKAAILSRIDQRLATLQEVRACVSAATNPEAIRACEGTRGGGTGQVHQR